MILGHLTTTKCKNSYTTSCGSKMERLQGFSEKLSFFTPFSVYHLQKKCMHGHLNRWAYIFILPRQHRSEQHRSGQHRSGQHRSGQPRSGHTWISKAHPSQMAGSNLGLGY